MRCLVLSHNYSNRYNSVHEIFLEDLFRDKDAIFFGPGYPLWEDKTYSAVALMQQFDADVLLVFHSKRVKEWIKDIELVKYSINYQVDYYPRERERWRDDFLILNRFNLVVFQQRHMIDRFVTTNKGRKLPLTLLLPFSTNTGLFKPDPSVERDIDVTGVMSINDAEYPNRVRVMDNIANCRSIKSYIKKVVSPSIDSVPLPDYISLLQRSKLGLHSSDKYKSAAIKCFEIMGSGAVLLTDTAFDFDILGFERDVHFVYFTSNSIRPVYKQVMDHLKDKDKLAEISKNAVELINSKHTNQHRVDRFWSFVKGAL